MQPSGRQGWQTSVRQPAGQRPDILQAIRAAKLHKKPRVVGIVLLWAFGLSSVFLLPAPQRITQESFERFEMKLKQVLTPAQASYLA